MVVLPVELKHRLNYFNFYSDKLTKKAMDSVKEHNKGLLEADNLIIPQQLQLKIQAYLEQH